MKKKKKKKKGGLKEKKCEILPVAAGGTAMSNAYILCKCVYQSGIFILFFHFRNGRYAGYRNRFKQFFSPMRSRVMRERKKEKCKVAMGNGQIPAKSSKIGLNVYFYSTRVNSYSRQTLYAPRTV